MTPLLLLEPPSQQAVSSITMNVAKAALRDTTRAVVCMGSPCLKQARGTAMQLSCQTRAERALLAGAHSRPQTRDGRDEYHGLDHTAFRNASVEDRNERRFSASTSHRASFSKAVAH